MEMLINDKTALKQVKFGIGELIDVKGAIFKICSMTLNPQKMEIQPANPDQIQQFLKDNNPMKIEAPKLTGAPDKIIGGTLPPTSQLSEEPANQDASEPK